MHVLHGATVKRSNCNIKVQREPQKRLNTIQNTVLWDVIPVNLNLHLKETCCSVFLKNVGKYLQDSNAPYSRK
jgi:hypothetical protein